MKWNKQKQNETNDKKPKYRKITTNEIQKENETTLLDSARSDYIKLGSTGHDRTGSNTLWHALKRNKTKKNEKKRNEMKRKRTEQNKTNLNEEELNWIELNWSQWNEMHIHSKTFKKWMEIDRNESECCQSRW
jgi:hypothetical protein